MTALYLHLPFREPPSPDEESAFTTAMIREMGQYARPPFTHASFQTLYVGGGHSSLLSGSALRTLVEAICEKLGATAIEEATLELHPSDASPSFLSALRNLGFTRLSIHGHPSIPETRRLVSQARAAGFGSMSVDLFFGPRQSLAAWKTSLHRAIDLRVPHVTLHEQEPEETQRDEERRADQFAFAMTFLDAKGYEQYELTHFARPGHHSHYQTHVYAHGNVLGLGPGAESFWWPDRTDPSTARRWTNVTDTAAYVKRLRNNASPVAHREPLDRPELAREHILLRLRTSAGLDLNVLADRYGCSLRERRGSTLDRLTEAGLIHDDPNRVRLTPRGRLLADAVTQRLIRET